MSGQSRENMKRVFSRLKPAVAAQSPNNEDVIRFNDLATLGIPASGDSVAGTGDLTGTWPDATVVAISGITTNELQDGEFWVFDGTSLVGSGISAEAILNEIGTTNGDLLWNNGGTWESLGVGGDGQVLTVNGTSLNWETPAASGASSLSTSYIDGYLVEPLGNQTAWVNTGTARASEDNDDITLTSPLIVTESTGTVSQANGNEFQLLTGTIYGAPWVTTGALSGVGSDFLTHWPMRQLTGLITIVSSSLTGEGTLFGEEIEIGDMVGSPERGWTQVSNMTDNNNAGLATAAVSGFTSEVGYVIENPHVSVYQVATEGASAPVARIDSNTLMRTGGSYAYEEMTVAAGGRENSGGTNIPNWYAVWICKGPLGVCGLLSTQRTALMSAPSGYDTSTRRIGWIPHNIGGGVTLTFNDTFYPKMSRETSLSRDIEYSRSLPPLSPGSLNAANLIEASGTSTTWNKVNIAEEAPPNAIAVKLFVESNSSSGENIVSVRQAGIEGPVAGTPAAYDRSTMTKMVGTTTMVNEFIVPVSGIRQVEYKNSLSTGYATLWITGFTESFKKW